MITEEKALGQQRSILAPEVFQKKAAEFRRRVEETQKKVQGQRRELDQIYKKAMTEVRNRLIKIIAEMAKEAQARVVLDKRQVLMVENNLDFSAEALSRLNKALPQVKVTAAARKIGPWSIRAFSARAPRGSTQRRREGANARLSRPIDRRRRAPQSGGRQSC